MIIFKSFKFKLNEIRNGNIRIKRHMSHKHNQMKNVNLMKSSHFLSSSDEMVINPNIRIIRVGNATITTTPVSDTICIPRPTTAALAERRKRDTVVATTAAASNGTDCVDLPKPDEAYKNFSIIMAVILSCIFAVMFLIFYFCTKDLFLELVGKTKSVLQKPRPIEME